MKKCEGKGRFYTGGMSLNSTSIIRWGWVKGQKGKPKEKMGIHLTWQIEILPRTGPLPKNIICVTQRSIIKSVHCMKLGSFLTFSIKAP